MDKNNMYPDTITWNPLGGECSHNCEYCYRTDMMRMPAVKAKYTGPPRLCYDRLPKTESVVFVCSMTDLFASPVPVDTIMEVLEKCREVPNTYLFQTKNPRRIFGYLDLLPEKSILGTTIETNRQWLIESKAPRIGDRISAMEDLYGERPTMISIEPIMDFDWNAMVEIVWGINPSYVSIGADSKKKDLSEPSEDQIIKLVEKLRELTEVRIKSNLKRLAPDV